ncbi:MAG: right-handed parallel beta-helix repeat-containing protein [Muribaculaceae bacterium]|nr:right-handed parallel beta-helix repeat-containing protein [Muribaculaceae bacterium]
MKFRLLLASAVLATASISAYADTFYVSPEGAGEKTGVDAENAMGVAEFRAAAAAQVEGTVFEFAGGTYDITKPILFPQNQSVTLLGNAEGERTVFSAANADPDATVAAKAYNAGILFINTVVGDQSEAETPLYPVKISNIDFCDLTTNKSTNDGALIISAIGIDNSGYVEIENCNFKNNVSTTKQGGPAISSNRSTVYVRNCNFENNKAGGRGGAVNLRTDKAAKGITVFENCLFNGNEVNGTDGMGGAVFAAQAKNVTISGCTFTGNKATLKGSVLFANGHPAGGYAANMFIINSTIADNPAEDGPAIMIGNGSNVGQLYIVNNVIVQKATEARAATDDVITPQDGGTLAITSGGYNYLGTVVSGTDTEWAKTTDQQGKDYASIFGTNVLNTTTGLIKPKTYVQGATGTELAEAVAEWALPAHYTVDAERGEDVAPGAGAFTQQQVSTGIADIANDADAVKVIALGGGNYTVAGYEGAVEVYSVSGARVLTAVAPELNLSGLASGVYIVRAGKTVAKVVR